ncbi:MAG: hypothetical protein LIP01_01095, partial [Tannerellaceae bacterium]|nr:hypothetical protein [Tannerellaceae bacterium]
LLRIATDAYKRKDRMLMYLLIRLFFTFKITFPYSFSLFYAILHFMMSKFKLSICIEKRYMDCG